MKYGQPPVDLGTFTVACNEMMFYQYLPIKLAGDDSVRIEPRLECFRPLIAASYRDFLNLFGYSSLYDHNIYLTAKHLFQSPGCSYNREGYHSDGFMTDDINYIWSNKNPTVFNLSHFFLTQDDSLSMKEMEQQALKKNEVTYPNYTLLRLNQFNIHKVGECKKPGIRTFVKISFSKDKYDLIGNSHNYLLDYSWPMRMRSMERNIPQKINN